MKVLKEFGITSQQLRRIMAGRKIKPKIIKTHITEEQFEFAVVSDTHLCSKEEKLNELHTFYAICKKLGVKHVVHAGDLVAGQGIYRGQENEIRVWGADNQINYAIKQYPKQCGIKTYFITGN